MMGLDASEPAPALPSFALSFPVQVAAMGIVLAMAVVMTLHLVFTAPFHYPLSRLNFILQLTGTLLFLVNVAASLGVVLRDLRHYAQVWPHVMPYASEPLPPPVGRWTVAQVVFFTLLQSATTASAHVRRSAHQITHIQFLTLLFPSALEKRLILWMLGPLALVQAGMFFTSLADQRNVKVLDLGDAIQNICESTLALLYTIALVVWGTFVNWRRAWRTDGATAMFGAAALFLAFVKTVISFVHIVYDRTYWIQLISWALTVWQSWLGFWWWGIGEVEDRLRRQERARQRHARRQRRQCKQEPSDSTDVSSTALQRLLGTLSPRRTSTVGESIPMAARPSHQNEDAPQAPQTGDSPLSEVLTHSETQPESASSGLSQHTTTYGTASEVLPWVVRMGRVIERHQPNIIRQRLDRLRIAHQRAAMQAVPRQASAYAQVTNRAGEAGPSVLGMQGTRPRLTSKALAPKSDEENAIARMRLQDRTTYD